MDDAHDAEPEPTPYICLPWAVVAAALAGVLLLALVVGLFANRYLRPQVGVVPTPITLAAAPAPTPALAPTIALATAPTLIVVEPSVVRTATSQPVSATLTLTSVPATATATSTVPNASAVPTVDPSLSADVGRAYEMFWHVRSQALLELDKTHLAEVMDGDYLEGIEQLIDSLRSEGRAIKTKVTLSYSVVSATAESAQVLDDVEDNSVYVNIGTEEPLSSPTADQFRLLYRLQNFSGVWKVVDSVRSE
jgi:hypothetical protein